MKKNFDLWTFCPTLRKILSVIKFTFLFTVILGSTAEAQQLSVSGIVSDINKAPMPGVNIVVKGTSVGAITDSNGRYSLNVPDKNSTLVFSFIGYTPQEVAVSGRNILDIILESDVLGLDEVVVIGYGTAKRSDLTGSVGSVGVKELQDLSVTRVEQALLGKLAGVQVKATSGEPGIGTQIRIRGIGSISASVDPLYVVDGFPTDNISSLSPNDIESIDILKDASATAIYGSRGANGVILITTKRGTIGKGVITFDTYYGWQKALKVPKYMNAQEQAQYYYDGIKNRNIDNGNSISGLPETWKIRVPQTVLDVLNGKITVDRGMFDDVLQTAPIQQHQLSATGGSESVKYALSGEYLNQEGIIINTGYERYSVRANIDADISKKLSVKMSLNPSFSDSRRVTSTGGSGSANEGVIAQATNCQPYYPLYNDDGTYFLFTPGMDAGPTAYNPVALAKEITNNQQFLRLLGNISARYSILENLNLDVMLGTSLQSSKNMYFRPNINAFLNQLAEGDDGSSMRYNWLTEYTLNYVRSFGKHNFNGFIGFTSQKDRYRSNILESNAYPNNLVPTLSAVSGIISSGSSELGEWSLVSYLARINYNYNSKYYLTASYRTDGSSRFGSESKYGSFPSVALAWRVSEENFLKEMTFLNELKLRMSYGETGNNNIGNYDQYATIDYVKYAIGNGAIAGFSPSSLANPSLTWEKQTQLNAGVDLGFIKNRIVINIDHFQSRNTDLLLDVNIPYVTGFTSSMQNIGEVKNTGWEFSLRTINFDKKFQWTTSLNLSTYHNEVVKLGPKGDPIYSGANVTMIGKPIGMFYGWLTDGIFLSQAEVDAGPVYSPGSVNRSRPGDVRFVDISGPDGVPDGIIDNSDKTIMGSPYPDFYYGMTNTFSYQNFSLNVSLQGSQGSQIISSFASGATSTRGRIPQFAYLNNYWKSEEDPGDGKTLRPNDQPTGNARGQYSQRWLDNGSFLRVNNILFSYLLPAKISQKIRLNSARIYLNSANPFIFTKNLNFNPDVSNSSNPLQPGRDNNDYPIPKSLVMGLNVTF